MKSHLTSKPWLFLASIEIPLASMLILCCCWSNQYAHRYSLAPRAGSWGSGGKAFAEEAVDQLVQLMTEPEHLHKTVVIFAGYKAQMDHMLATANPGLRSRIAGRIEFPDWDASDCAEHVRIECERSGINLSSDAHKCLIREFDEIMLRPGWANARDSTNVINQLYAVPVLLSYRTIARLVLSFLFTVALL